MPIWSRGVFLTLPSRAIRRNRPTTAATAKITPRTKVGPRSRDASTSSRPRLAMRVAGSSGIGPSLVSAGNDLVGGVDDGQPPLVLTGAALGDDAGADLDAG